MKLRLKNLETNETLKITVPDTCTISQLKQTISLNLSINLSIYLSLNRKDEISVVSETDTLNSLGIVSGDQIFFSVNPNLFVKSQTLVVENMVNCVNVDKTLIGGSSSSSDYVMEKTLIVENKLDDEIKQNCEKGMKETLESDKITRDYETGRNKTLETDSKMEDTLVDKSTQNYEKSGKETLESDTKMEETLVSENQNRTLKRNSDSDHGETLETYSKFDKNAISEYQNQNLAGTPEKNSEETMEYYSEKGISEESINMDIDDQEDGENEKELSVPGFLRKVFNKEFGDNGGCDHKLVVIAVHAVLIESGFITFDPVSKTKLDGFCLSNTRSLCYTLPEIVEFSGVDQSVVVKVQSLGKDVIFYGSLAGKSLGTYRVRFDGERLAIVLNLMWANVDTDVERSGLVVHPEKEILEFWKTVKDKLWLPLLSDLCEAANLPPPPNFTRLPTDMKRMILELLPGVDLAKATCVSRELQFLSSDDSLWKQKYLEQYGDAEPSNGSVSENSWKRKFVKAWQARKRSMRMDMVPDRPFRATRIIRPLPLFGNPRIIGGHHDIYPNIPGSINFGNHGLIPNIGIGGLPSGRNRGRNFMRNFAPQCNFGNRDA